jgi:Predicted ATPase of the PP-loop superfamily implicated in cell cycle control
MKVLNERYKYSLNLFLLSIDEGITGYRDDSLEVPSLLSVSIPNSDLILSIVKTVKRNQEQYDMPLKILSYDELYGWTMDAIVSQVGRKNNCTFCGVFRRQALDRGATMLNVDHIVTGHNADDIAETVLMNSERSECYLVPRTDVVIWLSHARRHCTVGTMYIDLYRGRGHHQAIQTIQIRLREGNRHVTSHTLSVFAIFNYTLLKGMPISRSSTTFLPNVYIPLTLTGGTHAPFSRT